MQPYKVVDLTKQDFLKPLRFFELFMRLFVTFFLGGIFALLSIAILLPFRFQIALETKLVFFGIALLIFLYALYLRRKERDFKKSSYTLIALWGNVIGFLLNGVFVLESLLNQIGLSLDLGGIQNVVLDIDSKIQMNLIGSMYAGLSAILYFLVLCFAIAYALYLKDAHLKKGNTIMAMLVMIGVVLIGFSFFLFVLFFQNIYQYIFYGITGSMFFIYGNNIFNRSLSFFSKI